MPFCLFYSINPKVGVTCPEDMLIVSILFLRAFDPRIRTPDPVRYQFAFVFGEECAKRWARHQREGGIRPPITQPCAPAHGSADIAIGLLFGLNPEVKDRGDNSNLPFSGGLRHCSKAAIYRYSKLFCLRQPVQDTPSIFTNCSWTIC